jgi:hypothetical protein
VFAAMLLSLTHAAFGTALFCVCVIAAFVGTG